MNIVHISWSLLCDLYDYWMIIDYWVIIAKLIVNLVYRNGPRIRRHRNGYRRLVYQLGLLSSTAPILIAIDDYYVPPHGFVQGQGDTYLLRIRPGGWEPRTFLRIRSWDRELCTSLGSVPTVLELGDTYLLRIRSGGWELDPYSSPYMFSILVGQNW